MQALWMVLGAFLFASMGVCIKLASAHFNSAELVFYRGIIGMVMLATFLAGVIIAHRSRFGANVYALGGSPHRPLEPGEARGVKRTRGQ